MSAVAVTMDNVIELLEAARDTQGPDFVYTQDGGGCFYRPMVEADRDYEPGDVRNVTACLIGVLLTSVGETRHLNFSEDVRSLARSFPDMFDNANVVQVLATAQKCQDSGTNWGLSVTFAKEEHARLLAARRGSRKSS